MSGFNHFNFIGPIYDRIFGRSKNQDIVAFAQVNQTHHLLDVGGGTGRVSKLFESRVKGIQIADPAPKMLLEAQIKGLRTVVAQSERLPYPNGAFDRVIMVDALHHVADQQKTLDEMWRLLAPGGKIVIEEPDINHFLVKLIALGEKVLLMRSHFLKPERVAAMCRFDPSAKIEINRKKGIACVIITRQK